MKTQTTTSNSRNLPFALLLIAVIALALFSLVLLLPNHAACAATTATAETSYTTTDRLYIELPNHELTYEFTTQGGTVNGGWNQAEIAVKKSTIAVNNWYDIYIKRVDKSVWYVPTSLKKNGKFYYDPDLIRVPQNSSATWAMYIDVYDLNSSSNMCTFIENGDKLYSRNSNGDPVKKSLISNYYECYFGVNIPGNAGTAIELLDSRPFDISNWKVDGSTHWTIEGNDDFYSDFGLNPITGTHMLYGGGASQITLQIRYSIGAIALSWAAGRAQNAHRSKTDYDYTASIPLTFTADSDPATITPSSTASNTRVSATWKTTTGGYAYADYSLNGEYMGEYVSDTALTSEGRYVITAHTSIGLTSSVTLYVDKTAPKFSSEFYDAQGNALIKYTKESSYTLPFPTAATNESAIVQTATYVYSYYDSAANKVISMPAEYYKNGDSLTKEGRYVITVSDAAGNSSSSTVIIDRSPPEYTSVLCSKDSVYASYAASAAESPITATYTLTTKDGTSEAKSYASGLRLSTEGRYDITGTDSAGNSSSVTLYVDKTAPALSRQSAYDYINTDERISWTVDESYESPITATYALTNASGTTAQSEYTALSVLSSEGKYTVTATDGAGNSTSIAFVIDKTAPLLTATPAGTQYTKDTVSVSWTSPAAYEAPINATVQIDDADFSAYRSGASYSVEGKYLFTATDSAGNSSSITLYIDKTAPELFFTSLGATFEKYTREPFTAAATDNFTGVEHLQIYFGNEWIDYDLAPRNVNGEYLFRAIDYAGNTTSATAVVFRTDTFGNVEALRDAFKLNEWYTVTLPARIFTTASRDVAGKYSFATYDEALAFAIDIEREFRVTTVQGGYMYVSATNETISQKYTDETTLNATIEKYAKGYISLRQYAAENGNDKFYIEPNSLTRNAPALPDFLYEYNALPRLFVRPPATWSLPNTAYIRSMPYYVTATYLGEFALYSGTLSALIPNGSSLKTALGETFLQGWYLITERDEAGNIETYLAYADSELPSIAVTAEYGDGTSEFTLDDAFVKNNTLFFISLSLERLIDNADEYITLKITRGSTTLSFTQSDVLPVLGISDGYPSGKYTITLFDRSLNILTFDVTIAGVAPTWTHGSLAADRPSCTVTFGSTDRYCVITSITLYKVDYDGAKTVIEADGNGVTVSAATLSYTLTNGGKYCAVITDNYRRTIELEPIFFLKGLPSGTLSGVKDGGRTNKNVAFSFDGSAIAIIYRLLPNGERVEFTDYSEQVGAYGTTYNITASETTSFDFLVFLYNAQDMSLYVEYTFEIDCILPTFNITDSAGNTIQPDGATNKSFSLSWEETGVTVRYYTAKSGALAATRYSMNSALSVGTLYYFTLTDDVGNTINFTVLLDNTVDYTIIGNYNEVNGVLYANHALTLTVNEPTEIFEAENSDGYAVINGGQITQEGRYDITVTDKYDNTVTLIIVLDFTPPTLELNGVQPGKSTSSAVTVTASGYDTLYQADGKGNVLKTLDDNTEFTLAGVYYITAADNAGNTVTVSFAIDLAVDYSLSVPIGAVTSKTVTLSANEPLDISVMLDGELIDTADKFNVCGSYAVTLTDELGNVASVSFVIVPTRVRTLDVELPTGTRIVTALKDGVTVALSALKIEESGLYNITLDCMGVEYALELTVDNTPPVVTLIKTDDTVKISAVDKNDVSMSLTCDGSNVDCRVGSTLSDPGKYVLTVTDDLGNTSTYKFEIKYRMNTWAIVAICVGAVAVVVVIVLIIRAKRKPRVI